ncbi:MAG TPA: hypothetical protein VNK52_06095 [Hyphomicrobiaceae bacterium]|nr:hypothetical protein [Hyphomicrobiaceae bacterium]
MAHIPHHVRARIISLGALSRPLGEDRAVTLALELTRIIAAEIARSGDPERPLALFESRLRREIAAHDRRAAASRGRRSAPIALHEILPEFPRPQ